MQSKLDLRAGVDPLLILAAVDRAQRHAARDIGGVPMRDIAAHLGLKLNPWTSRRLRPLLDSAGERGLLARGRQYGVVLWRLTDDGRARLSLAEDDPAQIELPESPQHRAWRRAREHAARHIDVLHADLHAAIDELHALLGADRPPHSDDWFAFADPLRDACWRLGSATHCLHEWAEPDDAYRDTDTECEPADEHLDPDDRQRRQARRRGRRASWRWDTDDPSSGTR